MAYVWRNGDRHRGRSQSPFRHTRRAGRARLDPGGSTKGGRRTEAWSRGFCRGASRVPAAGVSDVQTPPIDCVRDGSPPQRVREGVTSAALTNDQTIGTKAGPIRVAGFSR